jgi:hypothetical protein
VPADGAGQLREIFVKLAPEAPAGKNGPWDLLNAAKVLPGFKEDAAAVAALKGLKGKVTGHRARTWSWSIDRFLNPNKVKNAMPGVKKPVEKF